MMTVGYISDKVIRLLSLVASADRNIYLGETNITHMKSNHPADFEKYGTEIENILIYPDYVRLCNDGSIEYVKEYMTDTEFVKVAVRLSSHDKYYARTLYVLNRQRTKNFIDNGELKRYD